MQTLHRSLYPNVVCEEHGIWDSLPCPWPNCIKGHDESSFQEASRLEGERATTYTRRKWLSPIEGSYYTWDDDRFPNWFSVPKAFLSEVRRHKLASTKMPSLVYHYTSLDGFVGIINSRSLWLSDYSYLNDKRELTHGIETIVEVINGLLRSNGNSSTDELLRAWNRELSMPSHRICIASFSSEDDSLSQWRAYGSVAIGIEPQHLPMHAYQANLRAVEYSRDMQLKLARVYVSHLVQAYEVDLSAGRLDQISDIYLKGDRLVELAAFFKDPAFSSEQEYRLAYIEYLDAMESLGVSPPPKRFRVCKSKLLPYVSSDELFPDRAHRLPLEIKEVVLGPDTDELLDRGVREFLISSGLPNVNVRRSKVPYRA